MNEKINILSCGIFHEIDIPYLKKQKELFQKYSVSEINFVVIIGKKCGAGQNMSYLEKLKSMIERENIQVLLPSEETGCPSVAAAIPPMYGLKRVPLGKCFSIHLDLLPLNYFDINKMFENYNLGGIYQAKGENLEYVYLWENMFFVDTTKINPIEIDFYPCEINKVRLDTGGKTRELLLKYQYKPIDGYRALNDAEAINSISVDNLDNIKILKQLLENKLKDTPCHHMEYFGNCFLHYRSATNWQKPELLPWMDNIRKQNFELIQQFI